MSHLEPLIVIPWKRLLAGAAAAGVVFLSLILLLWAGARSESGEVAFYPTTVADEVAMGRQFFRYRYIWLRLHRGETVIFDTWVEPASSIANVDIRNLATFWHFDNAAICNAVGQLTFVAPSTSFYRARLLMVRRAYGGSEPTVVVKWRVIKMRRRHPMIGAAATFFISKASRSAQPSSFAVARSTSRGFADQKKLSKILITSRSTELRFFR